MTYQAVTATTLANNVLHPGMDAIALQDHKRRLIHHPETREPDSLIEILAVISGAIEQINELVRQLAETNGLQLVPLHAICGYADHTVAELRAAERNPDHASPSSGRQLARQLAELLDTIDGDDPVDGAVALTDLFLLFGDHARDLLFRAPVTYQLGKQRTARLAELHDLYTARRRDRTAERRGMRRSARGAVA